MRFVYSLLGNIFGPEDGTCKRSVNSPPFGNRPGKMYV